MSDKDELERQREIFAEEFEDWTGWYPDDYPSQDVAQLCWEMWKAALARKQEES